MGRDGWVILGEKKNVLIWNSTFVLFAPSSLAANWLAICHMRPTCIYIPVFMTY